MPGERLALLILLFLFLKLKLESEHKVSFYFLWSQLLFKDEKCMSK